MNVLVTGAKGFVGQNLIATLHQVGGGKELTVYATDVDTDPMLLDLYCKNADFVFHLAGVNRPLDEKEFMEGNCDAIREVLENLRRYGNSCPVVFASSIQAELDNPYGRSKKAGEDLVFAYGRETGASVYVYRFPNIFGKWCRPNYNSVIATFCYNIARDMDIHVNDPSVQMRLVYIDDVVQELIAALRGTATMNEQGFGVVPTVYETTLGMVVEMLYEFRDSRDTKQVPDMTEGSLAKKLYATYLSYLPEDGFSYPLKMNVDHRGSFTEILRTKDRGQFSVNISKPGITKGEHWHNTKNEKFVVVSGNALIQFRKVGVNPETGEPYPIIEYRVSGEKIEVVDIPIGYTHNIINVGETDLITFMWNSDCFDPTKPDTYFLKVEDER